MGFFLMSAPAFLLVKLDILKVTEFRADCSARIFDGENCRAVGTVAFALDRRLHVAIGIGLIAAFALPGGAGFLRQMETA